MPLADFTITVHYEARPRDVRVVVYETVKGLRSAASRYDNATGCDGHLAGTVGVCHRFRRGEVAENGEFAEESLCAIVRLAQPMLGVGYVSHELAHAAVWMHELDVNSEGAEDYPGVRTADDEAFCWVLGELVRQTVIVLDKRDLWGE